MAAPTAKLAAEASAAWTGRALERLGDAELVAGVRAQRVVGHELLGDLFRERGIEAAADVDRRQLRGARPGRPP